MVGGDEIIAIVDELNTVIGSATRAEMRSRNLVHRATYVLVFDTTGAIFLHKRTASKDVFPGYYDVAAGGVVLAGEEYDVGARRELAEELGIEGVPLASCFDFFFEDGQSRAWGRAYRCTWDGSGHPAARRDRQRRLPARRPRARRRFSTAHAGWRVRAAAVRCDVACYNLTVQQHDSAACRHLRSRPPRRPPAPWRSSRLACR